MNPNDHLDSPAVPALPIPQEAYNRPWAASTHNVLRLYFNLLSSALGRLFGPFGGRFLNAPNGSFYDTTDQYDGATSIPYAVRFNSTAYSNGISITSRTFSGTGSIGPASTTMTITAVASGRIYPSMVLSGATVITGTYAYLQLSSTAPNVSGTFNYVSGGAPGATTVTLSTVAGLEARQFVSGTGVPANTRITYVDTVTNTITLSAAFTIQAAGAYTFKPWGYEGTYSVNPSQTSASGTITGNLPSMITPVYNGLYNVQISLQFTNTTNNVVHEVDVWFRKNDVDIPDSNSRFSIPGAHSGLNGQLIAALNFFADLQSGDVLEVLWHTDNSDVYIETIAATTNPIRPQTPSAIVTVAFVSSLP